MNLINKIALTTLAVLSINTNSDANTFNNTLVNQTLMPEMVMFDTNDDNNTIVIDDLDEKVDCDNNPSVVTVPPTSDFTLNIDLTVPFSGANIAPGHIFVTQMVGNKRVNATLNASNISHNTFDVSNTSGYTLNKYGFTNGSADVHVNVAYTKPDGTVGYAFKVFSIEIGCPNHNSRLAQGNNELDNIVFPNPFENELHLDLNGKAYENFNISMYDVQGRLVKELPAKYNSNGNYTGNIYTDDLPSGVYILKTDGQTNRYSQRVIKL